MSAEEIKKIEDIVLSITKNRNKASLFNIETIIKLGFALIMGSFAYAGMSYKVDSLTNSVGKMEANQAKQIDKDDLRMSTMKIEIQTLETRCAIMEQQLKDMQNDK